MQKNHSVFSISLHGQKSCKRKVFVEQLYRLFRYPFKNSAFEKCFKSACILKLSLEHFKMNCMFLRDFKMRKKSKFEKYISIIIDSLASALKNVLILRGRCTLGLMDYKMVGQWTKDSLSRLHRHSY